MNKLYLRLVVSLFSICCCDLFADSDWPVLVGPYLGQNPPGLTVEMFAPGIISTDQSEINSVCSPGGDEFYFTAWTPGTGTKIMVSRLADDRWSKPVRFIFRR